MAWNVVFLDGDNFCKAFAGAQVNLSYYEWLVFLLSKILYKQCDMQQCATIIQKCVILKNTLDCNQLS